MGHRGTIALACLALLGAGLWLLLAGGERRGEGEARAGGAPEAAVVDATRTNADLVAPAVPETLEPARAPLAAEVETPAQDPSRPGAGSTVLLELVLAGSGSPASLADVWYRSVEEDRTLELGDIDGPSVEGAGGVPLGSAGGFREVARKARADELGLVTLPCETGRFLVVLAQKDGHLGTTTIGCGSGTGTRERLELVRDGDLCVRVLHANGEPAAKIGVFLKARSAGSGWSEDATTGADGLARFAHAGLRALDHPGASWSTGVTLPVAERLESSFDPADPPAEPILFRLPPLGEVEVLVLELGGEPAADGTEVSLGLVGPDEPRELSPFSHSARTYVDETTRDGRALFPAVEPGFEVEVRVGRWQPRARGFFPGPARAGERVRHTLRIGLDHPVLVFRAVDEDSRPLGDTALDIQVRTRAGWSTSQDGRQARTDAGGLFQLDLPGGWKEGVKQEVRVTAREGAIGAKLDLSRAFENGRNEMGDLLLGAPPLLARGRVIDAAGKGVAGVQVELQSSNDGNWSSVVDAGAKSDERGEFVLHGFVFGDRLRLTPRFERRSGAGVECERGASGVVLTLVATGAVVGAVLLDEGIPPDQLELRLVDETAEDEDEGGWHRGPEVTPSGAFAFDDQLPGRYSLKIGLQSEQELLEISAVEVLPGETNRDPRLAAIDLRGRLFVTRLRFLPPEADADLQGTIVHRPRGAADDEREGWHWFQGNPAVLVTPHASLDVDCSVRGYRAVRLQGVQGEREVPLTRAMRVRLVLPPDVTPPAPPTYLKATLVEEAGGNDIDWSASPFDETRESVSQVGMIGRMRVQWLIERRTGNSASATTLELEPVQWVEVRDLEDQRFELEVSREALEKALAKAPF